MTHPKYEGVRQAHPPAQWRAGASTHVCVPSTWLPGIQPTSMRRGQGVWSQAKSDTQHSCTAAQHDRTGGQPGRGEATGSPGAIKGGAITVCLETLRGLHISSARHQYRYLAAAAEARAAQHRPRCQPFPLNPSIQPARHPIQPPTRQDHSSSHIGTGCATPPLCPVKTKGGPPGG